MKKTGKVDLYYSELSDVLYIVEEGTYQATFVTGDGSTGTTFITNRDQGFDDLKEAGKRAKLMGPSYDIGVHIGEL